MTALARTLPSLLLVLTLASSALAEEEGAFALSPAAEVATLGGGIGLVAFAAAANNDMAPPMCGVDGKAPCDVAGLSPMDRHMIGNDCVGCRTASDVALYAAPATAAVLALFDASEFGWKAYAEDLLIIGEVVAISTGLQQTISVLASRPRPYLYGDGLREPEDRTGPEAARSFYSGHTSTVFALATAWSYLHTSRRPQMRHPWLVYAGAWAVASPMALLRVEGGSHFWSDVLIGAGAGIGTGLIIPWLHERQSSEGALWLRANGSQLSIGGTFM